MQIYKKKKKTFFNFYQDVIRLECHGIGWLGLMIFSQEN